MKRKPYKLKSRYFPETGRTMKYLNNGKVRLGGSGPFVELPTASRLYAEADAEGVNIGSVLDAWAIACPALHTFTQPYDEDEPQPVEP